MSHRLLWKMNQTNNVVSAVGILRRGGRYFEEVFCQRWYKPHWGVKDLPLFQLLLPKKIILVKDLKNKIFFIWQNIPTKVAAAHCVTGNNQRCAHRNKKFESFVYKKNVKCECEGVNNV